MKIEIEKPFIPQFVADWIEQLYGQGFDSDDLLEILFSRDDDIAELRIFDWFTDDKERAIVAILYGYEIEQEPVYYAKVKGWNLTNNKNVFWNYRSLLLSPMLSRLYFGDKESNDIVKTKLTKEEWNELGINDTNADFEGVD